MATAYVGPRPVLKGRTSANMVHPYKNRVGTYSFWVNWSPDQVLDGAPDNNHVPGTGRHPGNVFLSQVFRGTSLYIHPLSGSFADGAGYDGARFRPNEYKGLTGAKAFPANFGHADRVSEYSYNNNIFDGVTSSNIMANTGHARRTEAQGAASSFGFFIPAEFKGVTSTTVFTSGYGQSIPEGYDNEYGRNRVKEFRGVPSAKAL
jgi:hypothetical protein